MGEPDQRVSRWVMVLLTAAWLGVWGAWMPHPAVALRANAIDLAEWATFLTEVQTGGLRLTPDLLRLAIALAQMAFSLSAASAENRWLRWALRGVALIPCLVLLPPYPFVLQLWRSESYGLRFMIAAGGGIGVLIAAGADRQPRLRQSLIGGLSLAAAGLSSWAFASLVDPFSLRYGSPLLPGWGVVLFNTALIAAAVLEGVSMIRQNRQPQAAPGIGLS